MNYFEVIKAALDALVDGICRHRSLSRQQAMRMAAAHLQTMSAEWFSGDKPNIVYGDPLCRFAYLYCHTGVNANLCEVSIRDSAQVADLIERRLDDAGELKVCAFGGGPGTELLALSKHLCNTRRGRPQGDINFTLLDLVPEWAESWNALESNIKECLRDQFGERRNWPFTISKTFQPYDMTRIEQYANLGQLFRHDLYVLNYVLSEIFTDQDAFARLVARMAQEAPAGAMFLIVDRDQPRVVAWARELLAAAGLNEVQFTQTNSNMDLDERRTTLMEYEREINHRPRLTWRGAFWIVGVKP
ncbi:MAG: hypothetical protein EBZ67_15210 [Chitinophagia bacterium]|nr:hypothetical protein [Chitinophagia bacterium]